MTTNQTELDKISTSFSQFIIAVNGTLIAYSIKLVEDSKMEIKLIPLGLAIIFWAMSFLFGISSVRKIISSRITTEFKELISKTTYTEINQQAKDQAAHLGNLANTYNRNMYRFLYIGGICFIIWQLTEMIIRTIDC